MDFDVEKNVYTQQFHCYIIYKIFCRGLNIPLCLPFCTPSSLCTDSKFYKLIYCFTLFCATKPLYYNIERCWNIRKFFTDNILNTNSVQIIFLWHFPFQRYLQEHILLSSQDIRYTCISAYIFSPSKYCPHSTWRIFWQALVKSILYH